MGDGEVEEDEDEAKKNEEGRVSWRHLRPASKLQHNRHYLAAQKPSCSQCRKQSRWSAKAAPDGIDQSSGSIHLIKELEKVWVAAGV